ncbi:MAG: hypothetical protein OEZ06_11295 [Myxococcales bacterium]|nr:hypothetical protein [Myxococcales bacterium]
MQPPWVECPEHGRQPAAFVCQHIIEGLNEGLAHGFYWAEQPEFDRPDAWCGSCQRLVEEQGGEWTESAQEQACIGMLCGLCYDQAKAHNLG